MKHFISVALSSIFWASIFLASIFLTGCQDEKASVTIETSAGGIEYVRLYIPDTDTVAIQIAWPSRWAFRNDVNQAVPYIGSDLILAGGAEGYPPGEVVEGFIDLKAEGRLVVTPDYLLGQLSAPKENLEKVIEIAAAHLKRPMMDQGWFGRIQQSLAANMGEIASRPVSRGYDALRFAILGDTPLRLALSLDSPEMITQAKWDEVLEWHRQTMTRTGVRVVIAGAISAKTAEKSIDALLSGLPDASPRTVSVPSANFAPRRILLHAPDARVSCLIFIGPLPLTQGEREFEDIILTAVLGGDNKSVLFDVVRTGLRASYGFGASLAAYTRDLRILVLSGEVETAKLADTEVIVRDAYANFLKSPNINDLTARKDLLKKNVKKAAMNPVTASYSALVAIFDGQDPNLALTLPALLDKITDTTIKNRADLAFPAADRLIVLAVSPDVEALPGACVITSAIEAVNCR